MKRIVLNLILMVTCFLSSDFFKENQSIELKPLVIVAGCNYKEELNLDGYTLISDDINYTNPGDYEIMYQNNQDKKIYSRKLKVVNSNEIVTLEKYKLNIDKEVIDFCSVNDKNYVLLKENNENIIDVYYLNIYNDDVLIKEIPLNRYDDISFNRIVVSDNFLYIAGNYYEDTIDFMVSKYDLDGNYLGMKILYGDGDDIIYDIYQDNDYLFCIGVTDSYFGQISGNGYRNFFIITLDGFDLSIVDIYLSNKTKDIRLLKGCYEEDYIYLVINENGKYYVLIYNGIDIISTAELKELNNIYVVGITILDDYLYIFGNDNKNGMLSSFIYKQNMNNNKYEIIEYNNSTEFYQLLDYQKVDNTLKILQERVNRFSNDTIVELIIMDEETKILSKNIINKNTYCFLEDQIVFISDAYLSIEKIYDINLKTEDISYLINNEPEKITCEIGGDLIPLSFESLKLINNIKTFGDMEIPLIFECHSFVYIYKDIFYIDNASSVKENEEYGIGYLLLFKGEGFLNGLKIDSGYLLTNVGEYTLELRGNNEINLINFKIGDYHTDISSFYTEGNIDFKSADISIIEDDIDFNSYTDHVDSITISKNNYWLLIIPVLLSFLGIIINIRVGR